MLHGKNLRGLTEGALECLVRYDWPGNVCELRSVVEQGVIVTKSDILRAEDLSIGGKEHSANTLIFADEILSMPFKDAKERLLEEFQARYIRHSLERHSGNVSKAARESGLKRQYLHRLMRDRRLDSKVFKK
jgi:DNA-binding NtrC family response regulator